MVVYLAVLLCCLPLRAAAAEKDPEKSAAQMITPATDRAIDRGLRFLASRQNDDGGYGSGAMRGNVAICGLCGLTFLAAGSTPGRGPHGAQLNRDVDYLLAHTEESGYIFGPAVGHGPMYGHGFATLFLSECDGMSLRPELREKLNKAVKLIVNTQNQAGGWRYLPQRQQEADISVTVCQVMALRAARNAGLYVPNETIDRAVGYVKQSQNPDGGFRYMIQGGESAFPRSAAALVALYSAGIYKGPEITKGLRYLMQFVPQEGAAPREAYYEYGHYYAAQAMWQAGGEEWNRWYPAIRDELVARQREDGSWTSGYGPEYATAMCLLVLQVPNNCLPIFQR